MRETRRSFLLDAANLAAGLWIAATGLLPSRRAHADATVPGDGKKPLSWTPQDSMPRKYGGPRPKVMKPKYGGPPPPDVGLPSPTIKYGGPDVLPDGGVVDRVGIRRAVQARNPAIRGCYERELRTHPALAGMILVSFTIGRDGRAREVSIKEDTVGSPAVAACVTSTVGGIIFPRSPNLRITYPFRFGARVGPGD